MKQKGGMCRFLAERLDFGFWAVILFLVTSSAADDYRYEACAPKMCGDVSISYPFYIKGQQESYCAMYEVNEVDCSNPATPLIFIPGNAFVIDGISYENKTFRVHVDGVVNRRDCLPQFENTTFYHSVGFNLQSNLHFLSNCMTQLPGELLKYKRNSCGRNVTGRWDLVMLGNDKNLGMAKAECKTNIVVPVESTPGEENGVVDYVGLLEKGVSGNWTAHDCDECLQSGGRCGLNHTTDLFQCFCPDRPHRVKCQPRKKKLLLILGPVGAALVLALVLSVLAVFLICRRKKGIKVPYFLSRNYSKQSSKLDLEEASAYLGVSVFTYSELREATKNFDASKELGDGGFGTVYHGKLQDGREVAVKRLYEHNFKRLEQFMNEIEILTRLRHPNLVALYGCTSRRSRELLLVYEYVPNGTIADHLHGNRADHKYLTWAHRMSIAIETATALSYLHASDIIHRDVKTTNILLDHNFCVKVADFGLSRLFPLDVTHVSTAPQGTPGYVDPEYHQCYHLTDRSDVYSFGVVLVELISSMPAVDMSRHRHEINLANLAINRIQRCAFDELIDPSLGYKTNAEVMRMTTLVAELAFQCLQGEKEMRPSMGEVLQTLKDIRSFKATSVEIVHNVEDVEGVKDKVNMFSPESEDRVLLKNTKFPSSPVSVTHLWVSSSTSASTSSN